MYDVLNRVMKDRFVMLLTNSEGCRIGGKCEEGEEVSRIAGRSKREDVADDFGLEVIFAHNIGFFGVEVGVGGDVIDVRNGEGGAAVVIVAEDVNIGAEGIDEDEIGGVANAIGVGGEKTGGEGEVAIVIVIAGVAIATVAEEGFEDFLLCFVRTWS